MSQIKMFKVGIIMVEMIPILNISNLELEIADPSMTVITIARRVEWISENRGLFRNSKDQFIMQPQVNFKLFSVQGEKTTVGESRFQYGEMKFLLGLKAEILNQSSQKLTIPDIKEFPKNMQYPSKDMIPPDSIDFKLYVYDKISLSKINMNWSNFIDKLNKERDAHERELQDLRAFQEKRLNSIRKRMDEREKKHQIEMDKNYEKIDLIKKNERKRTEDMIDKSLIG